MIIVRTSICPGGLQTALKDLKGYTPPKKNSRFEFPQDPLLECGLGGPYSGPTHTSDVAADDWVFKLFQSY